MSEILLYYRRPDPTTWIYLSSFLTLGLFFVFRRFWSIRNLDVLLLILLAPGLLIVHEGYRRQLDQSELVAKQRMKESGSPPHNTQAQAFTAGQAIGLSSGLAGQRHFDDKMLSMACPMSRFDASHGSQRLIAITGASAPTAKRSGDVQPGSGLGNETPQEASSEAIVESTPITPVEIQRFGFVYLFFVEALILIRLMLDPLMVRRPLLDPNLTSGGLTFIGISMFIFMMANVVTSDSRIQVTQGPALGPGYALMNMLPAIPTRPISDATGGVFHASPVARMPVELTPSQNNLARIAKTLAIAAQLAIVIGIVLIGNRHFGNLRAGVGCATLYLLLPYTAQMTGRVDHAVPAALLLWAVLSYRRPLIAGSFLGLACGLVYYPLFLLPLWFSFYWQRGARSFTIGVFTMLALLVVCLSLDDTASLAEHLQRMFGLLNPNKDASELRGFWALGLDPIWRLPVIVAFVILCVFFAIWPAQKSLATLLSGSAAVMVAAQFWHGYGGGLYIAWFLPLLLLTIFRPNLQDRVATKMVSISSTLGRDRSATHLDQT